MRWPIRNNRIGTMNKSITTDMVYKSIDLI
jgi:hypothetical protein